MAKTLYYNAVTEEMEFVNNPSPLRENLGQRYFAPLPYAEGGRIGFQQGNITVHPIPSLSKDEARIFKMLQEGDLPHQRGEEASKKLSEGYKKPWNKLSIIQRRTFKQHIYPVYSKMLKETKGMLNREHLAQLLTEKLGVPINRFQVVGRGGTRAGGSKRTEFSLKLEELLQPSKFSQKHTFYKIPTATDIRELKKLVNITPAGSLKNSTVEYMTKLHKKFGSLYKKGKLPSIEEVLKAFPEITSTQAGNITMRLAQLYNGKEFKLFSNLDADLRNDLEKIKTDENTATKMFQLAKGHKFLNPYYSAMYGISLQTIDEKLGNRKGTFAELKVQARKLLKENKIPVYNASDAKPFGFNINEIVGVSGSAKSKAVEFSQFIDVMEGNLNQNILSGYQSRLSKARVKIEADPSLFESESKHINKLASRLEKEHGVKLARLRPSETVSKYYNPERLTALKEQGLDIEKASKRAGYTFQFPKGTQTILEFLKDPKDLVKIARAVNCPISRKAEGGRIGFAGGSGMVACIDAKFKENPRGFFKSLTGITSKGLDKLWGAVSPLFLPAVQIGMGRLEAFKDPTDPEGWWGIMLASDAVKRWGLDKVTLSQLKNASWLKRADIIGKLLLKFPGDKILTQAAKVARPLIVATETLSAAKGVKTELDLVKEWATENNVPYDKAKAAYYISGSALKPRWEGDKSFRAYTLPKLIGGTKLATAAWAAKDDPVIQEMGVDIFKYIKENKEEPVEEEVTEEFTKKIELPDMPKRSDYGIKENLQASNQPIGVNRYMQLIK